MSRILVVVEDDLDMQTLIGITLSADDRLQVYGSAATAAEAIERAREFDPELVVLDHFIHGDVMGLEAAPSIKLAAPAAKILLFTSHDLATEARREPAIDEYLSKNNIEQLLPTAQRLLGLTPAA